MRPQHRRPRVRALDCEMVGVGFRGKRSVLIRVSVVSRHGKAGDRGREVSRFVGRVGGRNGYGSIPIDTFLVG